MRLQARQLEAHLKSGVAPLYLVSGDEPLLVDETLDAIRAAARRSGCGEREVLVAERGFDWEALRASLANLSLFASRQLVELRLPTGKPGDRGAKELIAIAAEPAQDKVLIVITPAMTGRAAKSKWLTALADAGVWIALRAPGAEALPAWMAARLKSAGLSCDRDALELLSARVEGNLLAASQEIDKLVLLAEEGRVTVETVRSVVADGAHFDVFQLADAALAGDAARTVRILHHLEQEAVAASLVLWSLVREIATIADVCARVEQGRPLGRALSDARVWQSRETLYSRAVQRFGAGQARRILSQACAADRIVKGARAGRPWAALLELALTLAGADVPRAETA